MYLPPAAAWKIGHTRWPLRFLAVTGLLGLSLCSWMAASQPWGVASAILLILPVVCLTAAFSGLRRSPTCQLRWDGERWHWIEGTGDAQDQGVTGMTCVLDLQRVLLLRVECEPQIGRRSVRWLWLESSAMDARWLALRRAVVASPKALRAHPDNSLPG